MKELCRRDDEDNRNNNRESNRYPKVFPIEGIRQALLGEYSLDLVKHALKANMLESIGNDPLQLLDGDANVRLAVVGDVRCHEFGMQ